MLTKRMHDDALDDMFNTDSFQDDATDDLSFEGAGEEPAADKEDAPVKDEEDASPDCFNDSEDVFGDDGDFGFGSSDDSDLPYEEDEPEKKEPEEALTSEENDGFTMPNVVFDDDEEEQPEEENKEEPSPQDKEPEEMDSNPEAEALAANEDEESEEDSPEEDLSDEDLDALCAHENGERGDGYKEEPAGTRELDVLSRPFENIWTADPVSVSIDLLVSAENDDEFVYEQLNNPDLSFEMYSCDKDGNPVGDPIQVISAKDYTGNLACFTLSVQDPGKALGQKDGDSYVQKFAVMEHIPDALMPLIRVKNRVVFDVVTTREQEDGKLTGRISSVVNYEGGVMQFVNVPRFQPARVHFAIPSVSTFGKSTDPTSFLFVLSGDGIEDRFAVPDADGRVDFGEVVFRKVGSYHFRISQSKPDNSDQHFCYDLNPQEIGVLVSSRDDSLVVSRS